MSSYAARMHVLKCFLLRNHSIRQKLQILTVDIVKFLPNCSQRSQDWVTEYSEYSQCCLVYAPRGTEGILLKVSYGNVLTWNPSQQNCIEKDCESCKSRPIELNCKEVRTQAEEPNSCNCRNRVSNHFLVWLPVIRIILSWEA